MMIQIGELPGTWAPESERIPRDSSRWNLERVFEDFGFISRRHQVDMTMASFFRTVFIATTVHPVPVPVLTKDLLSY